MGHEELRLVAVVSASVRRRDSWLAKEMTTPSASGS
jgi:hypothetical protein